MDKLSTAKLFGLKSMPKGVYFSSVDEVEEYASAGQAHYMRRAFHSMKVDGILCVEGKPSVYLKSFKKPLQRAF